MRTTGALLLIAGLTENEPDETRPELNALYGALESRLQKAGAWMRWYRRTPVPAKPLSSASHSDAPAIGRITSGQDLLARPARSPNICASSRTAGCQHTI
jgi:type VI secretion system protein VasJ